MKTPNLCLARKAAFSLVELLVVIVVIAIIAAIAIPNIANITSQAIDSKDQRNAQTIASMASAIVAAKTNTSTNYATTIPQVIGMLQAGVTKTNSSGVVTTIGISPLSPAEVSGVMRYLTLTNGTLTYNPNPTSTN